MQVTYDQCTGFGSGINGSFCCAVLTFREGGTGSGTLLLDLEPVIQRVRDLCKEPVSGQDRTAEEADVGGNTWFMGFSFANTGY